MLIRERDATSINRTPAYSQKSAILTEIILVVIREILRKAIVKPLIVIVRNALITGLCRT